LPNADFADQCIAQCASEMARTREPDLGKRRGAEKKCEVQVPEYEGRRRVQRMEVQSAGGVSLRKVEGGAIARIEDKGWRVDGSAQGGEAGCTHLIGRVVDARRFASW
jgi:hypothetical protein